MTKKYVPLFVEETFLVNFYGTDEERDAYDRLVENLEDSSVLLEIQELVETLKARHVSKLDWRCCHRCQTFLSCSLKGLREVSGKSALCCSNCRNYRECVENNREKGSRCPV